MPKQTLVKIKKLDKRESFDTKAALRKYQNSQETVGAIENEIACSNASEPSSAHIVFDSFRCIKCWACELVCKVRNGIASTSKGRRRVLEVMDLLEGDTKRHFLSLSCQHCDNASCMKACPKSAIYYSKNGAVLVDKNLCVKCGSCKKACPYDVPVITSEGMDKCDMCESLYDNGFTIPSCVNICPTGALKLSTNSNEYNQSKIKIDAFIKTYKRCCDGD